MGTVLTFRKPGADLVAARHLDALSMQTTDALQAMNTARQSIAKLIPQDGGRENILLKADAVMSALLDLKDRIDSLPRAFPLNEETAQLLSKEARDLQCLAKSTFSEINRELREQDLSENSAAKAELD